MMLATLLVLAQVLYPGANNLAPQPSGCDSSTFVRGDGTCVAVGSGSLPSGIVVAILSGSCPAGWTEQAGLSGKVLLGTTTGSGDIGTTGGSDNITPTGTIAWPVGVPTFTGTSFSDIINHTHVINITDTGHGHTTQRYPTATGSSSGFTIDTSMSGTLADNTLPVKSNTTGISATSSNPAGGVASITPSGTVAWPAGVPAFTGTQFDNRSAWIKVIWCKKD